jgi:LAO/AO transport system kinase
MEATSSTIYDFKTLARSISLVENEAQGFETLLESLHPGNIPVIGFTGPPGAGKSTLLNAVIAQLLDQGKKLGLILIDPSSPFNFGALLGDRLRMSAHFNNPNIFIRSLASRGSLGGLSDKIVEILEVMKSYPFDYLFIETVGVGQSEVEIAGLADTTVVVLVPESGDSIQAMKAGVMEVADIFVVNKADRNDAATMANSLLHQLHISGRDHIPVLKTIAVESQGVAELIQSFSNPVAADATDRKLLLVAEKALRMIRNQRMKNFDRNALKNDLETEMKKDGFNLYRFVKKYFS